MPLYIVNSSTGYKTQPHAAAVPCGEVVELHESIGDPLVDAGLLIADYPNAYQTDEHRAKLRGYCKEKRPESPERKSAPVKPQPSGFDITLTDAEKPAGEASPAPVLTLDEAAGKSEKKK